MRKNPEDAAIALMVYETWLLNGEKPEQLPSVHLQKWVNRVTGHKFFPCARPPEADAPQGQEASE